MRKRMFLLLALFVAVVFLSLESLSYAAPNPPGPRGGPGAGPRRSANPPGPVGGPGAGPAMVNPPGPVGGPGAGPRRDVDNNPPGPAGGPGASPNNRPMINPPGPMGGPGAGPMMGNPPGPAMVNPPASESAATVPANLQQQAVVDKPWEKAADINKDGIVDKVEIQQWHRTHPRRVPQQ